MAEESTRPAGAADHGDDPTTPITPETTSAGTPQSTPEADWWRPSSTSEPTQQLPVSEPTQQLPTSEPTQQFSTSEPTQQFPTQGAAASPSFTGPQPRPAAPTGPTAADSAGTQAASGPYPYGQPGVPGQPPYGANPYGQQAFGQNPYPPYGAAGQYPPGTSYGYYNGAYPPPPPGSQPTNGQYGAYYAGYSPQHQLKPTATKQRWPMAVLAVVLAFALGVAGYAVAGGRFGATSRPQSTAAPQFPGSGQQPSEGESPSSNEGTTQSSAVSAAQSKGVALIEAATSDGTAYGTGMVLTADGKVLTNYHVVAGTTKVLVTIASTGDSYEATVLGFDQTKDVALLQLKGASGLDTVTLDQDAVSVGDTVAAVGNASGGMKLVRAAGKVTGTDQSLQVNSESPWGNTENLSGLVATNAGAVPGDSGGPMFDSQNEVLGMTTAGSTKEHSSYAIPIATAVAVVNQIETGQDAGTVRVGPAGYLGVRVADSSYTGSGGSTVASVVSNGPAAKAGITAGSRITKVGDTTITSATNVANVIRALEPGQQVKVSWTTAKGTHKQATVTIGSSSVN